ncbi:MAG: hypothetical protein LKG11_04150 [Bacilli bacterium]|jgi:hypothetical protein|nr:hypothetical protein [Bacilli bacterium]
MKQKKDAVTTFLIVTTALMATIALFVLFGDAFTDASRYSGFYVMFGKSIDNREAVPGLIVGFAVLILSIVLPFTSRIFDSKGKMFVFGLETILLAAAAVIFLFSAQLFQAANNTSVTWDWGLGAGTICCITFAFIGAAFSALAFLRAKHAK